MDFAKLPDLKQDGPKKYKLEKGCATAEVEVVEWEDVEGDGTEIVPFVLIKVTWLEEGDMSCVWGWWTDHYWSMIQRHLPEILERYCPAPKEVWETLVEAVTPKYERHEIHDILGYDS